MSIEYNYLLIYFLFSTIICYILFCISFFLVYQQATKEKFSSYECGFNPFDDARMKFDVKFYLVGILYIIFDLELIFLIPWTFTLKFLGGAGIISMLIFLLILIIGFYYEWESGALDW